MARIPRKFAGIGAADMKNSAEFDTYVGPFREVTVDPERGIVALHDGETPGGKRFATAAQGVKADTALQASDIGYDVGLVVEREDYQGERAIYTEGGQTVFARKTVGLSQANDWHFVRVQNTAGPDTTFGFVNSNARATTIVNATSDQSEWALTAICEVNAASENSQHVASYHQAIKNADARLWSLCTEMRDSIPDPTKGSVGIENGMFVKGTDNNNNRVATHIVIARKSGETGTSHEVARGLWITADTGNILVKWGLEIKGKFNVGVDLTGMDLTHSDRAINLQSNMFISWMKEYHDATQQAFLAWNASISTFQMGGMRTVSGSGGTVGAIVDHAVIQINGTLRAIPLYDFTP